MDATEKIKDFLLNGHIEYIPNVSVDCAIFGYHNYQLKILLTQNKFVKDWCLPGGFIKRSEVLVEAAERIVLERTGIENLFLQQFKAFGGPGRNKITENGVQEFSDMIGVQLQKDNWIFGQAVTIGFYAITDFSRSIPSPDLFADNCVWHDVDNLPALAFDHAAIIADAKKTLGIQLYHYPIGYNLLPEKFTLSEIHDLYEKLSGKSLDVSNFKKKLLSLGLIKKLDELRKVKGHRSPYYYTFDKDVYDRILEEGLPLT